MNWLRRVWGGLSIGVVAAVTGYMALQATARKREAEAWRKTAEDIRERDLIDDVADARAALSQAKLHDAEASRIADAAVSKLNKAGKKDETMASVLDRWRADRMR